MTASPESLQQRYEAIERVYSERQWDDVARLSETLLLELPDDASHPLRQRLQLLLGHTYLYGYKDAVTATGFYSRVRAATSEAVLRDIADQGLEQCDRETAAPSAAAAPQGSTGQAFPFSAEPSQNDSTPSGAVAAMPWMEQLGGLDPATPPADEPSDAPEPALVVDVIEEPELIDVAQADPARAEELEIAIKSENPAPISAPIQTAQEKPVGPSQEGVPNSLSPEEIAELSKGLLRVVIR
jgi:hypothetical protein